MKTIIHTMTEHHMKPLVLNAVWEQNKNYRMKWDWADYSSAVSSKSENKQ